MKSIFFAGIPFGFGGPRQVNKNIVSHLNGRARYLKNSCKILYFIELLYKIIFSDIIIFSGISKGDFFSLFITKLFNKKFIYIMHGFTELEAKLNNEHNSNAIKISQLMTKHATLILCVSRPHMDIIKQMYPQYSDKISFVTNGIDWSKYHNTIKHIKPKLKDSIVLIGGGRMTKHNLEVCRAVNEINTEEGTNYTVYLYGNENKHIEIINEIKKIPCVKILPLVDHKIFLEELQSYQLFIQNSDYESFSLGYIEAIICGCNVLATKFVGATDIIKTKNEYDIIENPLDINEIKLKIKHSFKTPNNERLFIGIDKNETSIEHACNLLINYASKL